jgi:tripartite-type tricarboxylate transporter receptor subunit TctC
MEMDVDAARRGHRDMSFKVTWVFQKVVAETERSGNTRENKSREDTMPRADMRPTAAIAFACMLAIATTAHAQDFPSRPMTMVIPFAAAGGVDVVGRIIAARMSELLGRPIVVENVGAAGGMVGSARVSRATPDGYQFVLGSVGTHAQNQTLYKNPLYNSATDFAPIALVAEQPIVLAARKDFPADNLPEFIAYTRAQQEKMQYGSPGTGSSTHLACALFTSAIGVKVTHIPFRTNATQDLIAGRTDYQCMSGAAAVPLIEGKLAKMIATLTRARWSRLPDLASAHEQGLTNFEAYIWYALFLPKGTPQPLVEKLHAAAVQAMETPAVQERFERAGATLPAPDRRSPEYLRTFVESEIAKWAGPIKAAGLAGVQ